MSNNLSPGSPPRWLADDCADILTGHHAGRANHLRQRAHHAGSRAAAEGISLIAVVEAILSAAAASWTTAIPDTATMTAVTARDLLAVIQTMVRSAADGHEHAAHTELVRDDRERDEFISDLLTGRADPGRLAQRAQRYGIRLSGHHQVAAVTTARPPTARDVQRIDDALVARFGAGNILTAIRDDHLICITAGGLRGVPAELAHQLLTHLGPGTWQIGVGRAHPGLGGLAKSLDEARNTLNLADRLGFTTPILNAADLLVFPVLLRDREAITDLVDTVLGPLVHARGGPQSYLDTLTAVFDHQGNQTAAARHLKISVRAVAYRLDRIHILTGYNPTEPTQRFTLHAAVLGARLLDWPQTTP